MTTRTITPAKTATPRETDEALAAIYAPRSAILRKIEDAQERLILSYVAKSPERRAQLEQVVTDCRAALAALDTAAEPFQAIYRANPWTRFFLVPGGHLHRSMSCSSFRWNTRIFWLPEYSGKTEAEIVALAGEAACTICYPSAPVDRRSMLPVHIAERSERDAEAARKLAARNAKNAKAIHADGTPWRYGGDRFQTIRSVELALHRAYDDLVTFTAYTWNTAEYNAERLETTHLTIAALSEKLEERTAKPAADYRADIEAKARKRNR